MPFHGPRAEEEPRPDLRTNRAISEELSVTERAVERHVTSTFGELDLHATGHDHRRVLAVLTYLRG